MPIENRPNSQPQRIRWLITALVLVAVGALSGYLVWQLLSPPGLIDLHLEIDMGQHNQLGSTSKFAVNGKEVVPVTQGYEIYVNHKLVGRDRVVAISRAVGNATLESERRISRDP